MKGKRFWRERYEAEFQWSSRLIEICGRYLVEVERLRKMSREEVMEAWWRSPRSKQEKTREYEIREHMASAGAFQTALTDQCDALFDALNKAEHALADAQNIICQGDPDRWVGTMTLRDVRAVLAEAAKLENAWLEHVLDAP